MGVFLGKASYFEWLAIAVTLNLNREGVPVMQCGEINARLCLSVYLSARSSVYLITERNNLQISFSWKLFSFVLHAVICYAIQ